VLGSDSVWKTIIQGVAKANQIPILLVPQSSEPSGYKVIQDTKDIIDYIEKTHPPSPANGVGLAAHPVVPETPKRAFASMMFEILADEWLVVQAMYWRWGPGIYEKQEKFLALDFGSVSSGGDGDFDMMLSLGAKVCRVCSRKLHGIRTDFFYSGALDLKDFVRPSGLQPPLRLCLTNNSATSSVS